MCVCEVKMHMWMGGPYYEKNNGKFGQGVVIELPIPLR